MEKMKDLRNKSAGECEKQLQELRLGLMKEYAQVAQGTTLKSPGKIKALKRTYARLMTVLKEKQSLSADKKKPQKVEEVEEKQEKKSKKKSENKDNLSQDRGR